MEEAFATEIAKSLLGKLSSFASEEFCLAWGLDADLDHLEEILSAINAVLHDAEKQQEQNDKIRLWLQKLREVLYDAEDVLDEVECETLRRKVVKTTGSTSRKVQRFFSRSNMIAFRLRMGHKIKNIIGRLARIESLKSQFNLSEQTIDSHVLHEETVMNRSFESFSGLIGRDKDKERIINLLVEPFKVGDAHPLVFSIVGMGGLGKTALAKSVHDDEIVKTNFEMKIEACVSDGFGLKQVIQKILKSATGDRCADLDEGELKKKLEAILNGRKYLLLLDDVWNEDAQKWLLLKPSLSKGAFGSKVIVTTRSQRVAEIMGTVSAYNLSILGQEHCLSLFYKCAFKERQMELYPDLVGIGKEIVAKCKQIPLAVINLGTQLYGKVDEKEWESVRDSEKWEEKGDALKTTKFPNLVVICQFLTPSLFFIQLFLTSQIKSILFADSLEGPTCKTDFEKCLSKSKHLRSLELLDDSEFEAFPEMIGTLKHLRYLSFDKNTKIKRLPKSIFKLQNLQALIVGEGLEELPRDVRYMISLRFLFLFTKQNRLPQGGIGCLECLQTLIIVLCENLEYFCEDMQGLKSLRKLFISGCNNLISLPRSMKCLTALEKLLIIGCENLDLMTIEEGKEEEIQTLSLQTVLLAGLPATLALPTQFLQGSTNSLRIFIIRNCPNIRVISECFGNLKKLQNLRIIDCPRLSKRCQKETGEDWPKIAHIPKIEIDDDDIEEETSNQGPVSSDLLQTV
ncbi:putative disease resistance protein RGA3 [Populus nigra]|uniref:putative disease resistance protein RGA3 n=1 Tax=Populus nigra TaxID=3691 RepID=UPI002B27412A|nr:putative disease resistance protein RGA3 [Populus nigra]